MAYPLAGAEPGVLAEDILQYIMIPRSINSTLIKGIFWFQISVFKVVFFWIQHKL